MDIAKQAMPLKGQQTHVIDLYALVIIAHIDAAGGPRGVHAMLLSTPAMHTLWPTRFWHSSGPLWS